MNVMGRALGHKKGGERKRLILGLIDHRRSRTLTTLTFCALNREGGGMDQRLQQPDGGVAERILVVSFAHFCCVWKKEKGYRCVPVKQIAEKNGSTEKKWYTN